MNHGCPSLLVMLCEVTIQEFVIKYMWGCRHFKHFSFLGLHRLTYIHSYMFVDLQENSDVLGIPHLFIEPTSSSGDLGWKVWRKICENRKCVVSKRTSSYMLRTYMVVYEWVHWEYIGFTASQTNPCGATEQVLTRATLHFQSDAPLLLP